MRNASLDMVHTLAKRDPRVIYIGSDPGPGTLEAMRKEFPERFFIEGISEANVIGMAAGLAMEGFIPYVNTIATFITRRCYEQIAIDLCLHNLPVRLIGNGAGFVYAPLGPTHQAIEDVAIMRALPNMSILCPADAEEMRRLVNVSFDHPGPIYIRVAKGGDPAVNWPEPTHSLGKAILMRKPGDVLFITTGVMLQRVIAATDLLTTHGIECGILHIHTIKPIDYTAILQHAVQGCVLVTVEEHVLVGGLGSAVLEILADSRMLMPKILRLGIPDVFTHNYGSQDALLRRYGLDADGIVKQVLTLFFKAQ